jgi:hypothetical protein
MSPTSPADGPMLRLAEDLLAAKKTEERLLQLTRAVVETVDGVDYASISFADHEGIRTLAATDDLVNKLDATQYELQEGPCYEAATQSGVVMTTDVGRDDRWPRFGPRAASLGIAAHVAHRILNTGDERAALNMYSTELGAIVADSEVVDMVLSEAALVLGLTRERDQVEEVMQSRTAMLRRSAWSWGTAASTAMPPFDISSAGRRARTANFGSSPRNSLRRLIAARRNGRWQRRV